MRSPPPPKKNYNKFLLDGESGHKNKKVCFDALIFASFLIHGVMGFTVISICVLYICGYIIIYQIMTYFH